MVAGLADSKEANIFALAASLALLRTELVIGLRAKESDISELLTSPELNVSSRGILGAEGRNKDICEPATVGTASAYQRVSNGTYSPISDTMESRIRYRPSKLGY